MNSKTLPFQVIVVCDKVNSEISAPCDNLLSDTDMFIRRDPCQVADSRNAALPFAIGLYTLFLYDDDAQHPNFLKNLHNQPAIQQGQLVYTDCSRVIELRDPQGPQFISEDGIDMTGRVNINLGS